MSAEGSKTTPREIGHPCSSINRAVAKQPCISGESEKVNIDINIATNLARKS